MNDQELQNIANETLYSAWLRLEHKINSYENRSPYVILAKDYFWQHPTREKKRGLIDCILGNKSDYLFLIKLYNPKDDIILLNSIKDIESQKIDTLIFSEENTPNTPQLKWEESYVAPKCEGYFKAVSEFSDGTYFEKMIQKFLVAAESTALQLSTMKRLPTQTQRFVILPVLVTPAKLIGCKLNAEGIIEKSNQLPYAKYSIRCFSDVLEQPKPAESFYVKDKNERTIIILSLDHYDEFMKKFRR